MEKIMSVYNDLKRKYNDTTLLFHFGNKYVMYKVDAITAKNTLGLQLSTTPKSMIKFTSFECNMIDVYLPKLVRAGYRIAICDNLEKPK